jgi:hypothetical protein
MCDLALSVEWKALKITVVMGCSPISWGNSPS